LAAVVTELHPIRYTPAGIPVLELMLDHSSTVLEAGRERQVQFQVKAMAFADVAHQLADTPLGALLQIEGFLAVARKGSNRLVLHIQQAQSSWPGSGSIVV